MLRSHLERLLKTYWRHSPITVVYWDGRATRIGTGTPVATVTFARRSVLWAMLWSRSKGFGDAFVHGDVTIEGDLQAFLRGVHAMGTAMPLSWVQRLALALQKPIPRWRAKKNAQAHYDTGNDFFRMWLDPSMTYSCAYFTTPQDTIEQAQTQKRELICRKLDLKPGMTLLDIGCGWGALLFHAIEKCGVIGTGITPAKEQAAWIRKEAQRRGIGPDRLTIIEGDWRELSGMFDRIVSVGMYEHVGKRQGAEFFRKWQSLLRAGGNSLLHTIGGMESIPPDRWIDENIFPGGYLPSLMELADHAAAANLPIDDIENLWPHYALTLHAWRNAYVAHADEIRRTRGDQFYRRWLLYLAVSEAGFAAGRLMLFQLVLSNGKRQERPLTRDGWRL